MALNNNENMLEVTKVTYDEISDDWDSKRRYSWKPVVNFVEAIEFKDKKSFLDIGCGGGRDLELALSKGFLKENIKGCDYSKGQVKVVLDKGFDCKVCDMQNLSFENSSFDVITCIAAFHHLLNRKYMIKALNEIKRVLKNDGVVLLSNWFPDLDFIKSQEIKGKFHFVDNNRKIVKVTYKKNDTFYDRYYYLFDEKELKDLVLECGFLIDNEEFFEGNYYLTLKISKVKGGEINNG